MAHENHVDLPDDFDALLRQTMSVEPSAGFLPRVRERIAAEHVSPASGAWQVLTLAGALSVIVMIGVQTQRGTPRVQAPPDPPVAVNMPISNDIGTEHPATRPEDKTSVSSAPPWSKNAPAARPLPRTGQRPRARTAPTRGTSVNRDPVVVVIDDRQRAALAVLMRLVGEGKLTDEAFAQTTPQSMGAISEQVRPVDVAPVEVSPIAVGGVLRVGTEHN